MPDTTGTPAGPLTLDELLEAVRVVDAHIDSATAADYRAQPLAAHWARVTKVCSEAGEVMDALSAWTGENPRNGVCGTLDDLLGELGDTASAAIFAIQHLTKDTGQTWAVVSAALAKAVARVEAHTFAAAVPGPGAADPCPGCGRHDHDAGAADGELPPATLSLAGALKASLTDAAARPCECAYVLTHADGCRRIAARNAAPNPKEQP